MDHLVLALVVAQVALAGALLLAALRNASHGLRTRLAVALIVVLLAGAAASAARAIESDPVPLGSEGLSLTVRLRQWTEDTGTWADVSAAAVDVVDEGDGEYSLADLPAATGADRYAVTLALSSDPDRGLYTYSYGALPGTRTVWREEIDLPGSPLTFKVGDTAGSISLVVLRRLPAEVCDGGTAATFTLAPAGGGAAVVDEAAAVITDCELDATTGTYGATLTYDLETGDLATAGRYLGQFTVTYDGGEVQTLPAGNTLQVTVVKRLGT
jgi:hypothetical protein